ncbi:hypothetical protein FGO68_gene8191 [Halteria grandinella]|uniref:Uncharacterized protein n=1 Tax=Halteria grandinella TaxID=5974 RepID=A0A8J8NE12_HALGN|nr:hypothetical protein FGO68_gene8191 [Halteria grandinella]
MIGMDSIDSIELLPGFGKNTSEGRFFVYRSTGWKIYLCNYDNFEIISILATFYQRFISFKAKEPNLKLKYEDKPPHPPSIYTTRLRAKEEEKRKKQQEEQKDEVMENSDLDEYECKVLMPVLDHWSAQLIGNYDLVCPSFFNNIQRFRFMLPQAIATH